ncbi:MAG TPA: hypothetical protein VKE40_21595 [Gemmataceae bacterium]|nr:hypothetical protein [Gemmataceae bacterium]
MDLSADARGIGYQRPTRDLLRRRYFFVRQRAKLITHIQNTNTQFNRPPLAKKLS